MKDERFEEALSGYLPPDEAGQGRLDFLISKLEEIAKL